MVTIFHKVDSIRKQRFSMLKSQWYIVVNWRCWQGLTHSRVPWENLRAPRCHQHSACSRLALFPASAAYPSFCECRISFFPINMLVIASRFHQDNLPTSKILHLPLIESFSRLRRYPRVPEIIVCCLYTSITGWHRRHGRWAAATVCTFLTMVVFLKHISQSYSRWCFYTAGELPPFLVSTNQNGIFLISKNF